MITMFSLNPYSPKCNGTQWDLFTASWEKPIAFVIIGKDIKHFSLGETFRSYALAKLHLS